MGGIVDIFTGNTKDVSAAPVQQSIEKTFFDIDTGGFDFRRDGAKVILDRNSQAFNQLGAAAGQIGGLNSQVGGLVPGVQALDPSLVRLQQMGSGLFDSNALLQRQIQQTIPQAGGLFNAAGGIGSRFGALEGELAGVSDSIKPGFGRLTDALVNQVRNERAAASGNLRENFAQRNLSGSSLALHEQRRLEMDFSQREEAARAQAFQQEMAATAQIAQTRGQILLGELGTVAEQRAVLDETRALISTAGNLLVLDQQNIAQQAQLVGMRLGLTQAEAGLYAQQMQGIQLEVNSRIAQIQAELSELGVSANIINAASQQALQIGMAEANLQTEAASQRAYNDLFTSTQQLGFLGNVLSLGAGPLSPGVSSPSSPAGSNITKAGTSGGFAAAGGGAAATSSPNQSKALSAAAVMGSSFMASSRDYKLPGRPVDHDAALAIVQTLPIEIWRYKSDFKDDNEHVGTYAEDWHDATGLGDGKTIDLLDLTGVLMSAVKALSAEVQELKEQIDGN